MTEIHDIQTAEHEPDINLSKIAPRLFLLRISPMADNILTMSAVKLLEKQPSTQTDNELIGNALGEFFENTVLLLKRLDQ